VPITKELKAPTREQILDRAIREAVKEFSYFVKEKVDLAKTVPTPIPGFPNKTWGEVLAEDIRRLEASLRSKEY